MAIMAAPDRFPVVRGTGGLRKVRFAPEGFGRGKRGAYRVGYVYFPDYSIVLLVTVWGKNEKSDISEAEKRDIAAMIRDIQGLLDKGEL